MKPVTTHACRLNNYPPQTKVMFLHLSVILFQGGLSQHAIGQIPPWQIPPRQTPRGRYPLGRHPWSDTPLDTMAYCQQVGSTHPTGTHTCWKFHLPQTHGMPFIVQAKFLVKFAPTKWCCFMLIFGFWAIMSSNYLFEFFPPRGHRKNIFVTESYSHLVKLSQYLIMIS